MALPDFLFPCKERKARDSACAVCGRTSGRLVGRVNYFGLALYDVVQCEECQLASVDPIPEARVVEEGCNRLYALQQAGESRRRLLRGFAKSYRRGARFARRFLAEERRSGRPLRVLEVGAGDGYFSAGIRSELPGASLWLVDVVEDLVRYYREHLECEAVQGELDPRRLPREGFDLVVFRDLLEHVRDPMRFLAEVRELTRPDGRIFFLTPNGREDLWLVNQRFLKTGEPTVLLLNHFHYFFPGTLARMLEFHGFRMIEAFKFGLKQHRRGLGHREMEKFGPQEIPAVPATAPNVSDLWRHRPSEIRNGLLNRGGLLSRAYAWLVDREREKVPFDDEKGHEFFVVGRRTGAKAAEPEA